MEVYIQKDIDAIFERTNSCHLTLNAAKCKYIIASRKRQPHLPSGGLLLGNCTMEQVHSYRYLGVLVTSTLKWKDHIKQICTKARKLIGMLYRQFSTWADTSTLRCLYLTCIIPHLEYACQLWDPYTNKGMHSVTGNYTKICLQGMPKIKLWQNAAIFKHSTTRFTLYVPKAHYYV